MKNESSSRRRLWPRLLLAVLVGALFFEIGMRVLLTSPWTRESDLARAVGDPARFAFSHEDLYWQFVHRLATSEAPRYEPPHDPQLGWLWPDIVPETYAHLEMPLIGERRPVFLFGDSYSACLTQRTDCFQGLMERSPLADRCQLLNYGVCGYGLDQTCLLTRAVVERWGQMDPVVVIGLLVDDDLTRMPLSLREYPKPRLRVEDGRLVLPAEPIATIGEYRANPPALPLSWAVAWLRQSLRAHPMRGDDAEERREVEELTRAVFADVVGELRARELDFFFVLFYTAHSFPPAEGSDWRTALVRGALDDLGAPWYDVREDLQRALEAGESTLTDYYIPRDQPGAGHYSPAGNAVAFTTLTRGLSAVTGLDMRVDGRPRAWAFTRSMGDGGGTAAFMHEVTPTFRHAGGSTCIVLRAPGSTSTSITYELDGAAKRFEAKLWAFEPESTDAEFTLAAWLDGRLAQERSLRSSDEPQPFTIELAGARRLELRLAPHVRRAAAVLSDPSLD